MNCTRVYGYCRISRKTQNIDRQERNILERYPSAIIRKEIFTGTKMTERVELQKILSEVKSGDTIVFDSASRMSRNEVEAVALYDDLFSKGINLVFLKEPQINTDVFNSSLEKQINVEINTGDLSIDTFTKEIVKALNELMRNIAREQVRLAFNQAEKEVKDLQKRTQEGLETAKRNGKKIGGSGHKESTLITKKSIRVKEFMEKNLKTFGGTLGDQECILVLKGKGNGMEVSRNTFYKYKRAILFDNSRI